MNPPLREALQRSFATVETSSSLDEIRDAIGVEHRRSAFRIVAGHASPYGSSRYDLSIDGADSRAAVETARSLLGSLLDAADRGMLLNFRIVLGADLLRVGASASASGASPPGSAPSPAA
jgi:hypothetical protein